MHTGNERAKSTVQQVPFEEREYKEFYSKKWGDSSIFPKTYSEIVLYIFPSFSEDNYKIIKFSPPETLQTRRIT